MLQYYPPDPALADLVSVFYVARFDQMLLDEMERADRPQFRFLLSGAGSYYFAGGQSIASPTAVILGPTSGPTRLIARGPVWVAGFGLMPSGWAGLMGADGPGFTDCGLDAAMLLGDWVAALAGDLIAAPDDAARVAIMANLASEILVGQAAPIWFIRLVDGWLVSSASPVLDELIAATGMSARSVERMTKRFYGLSPKMLARKYRALRAASALVRGEDLGSSGLSEGFYDQSHLIRELKQFAGKTPSQLSRTSTLTQATAAGRKRLSGRVSPLISDT